VDTEEELAGTLAALQRRSQEELATFILSLLLDAEQQTAEQAYEDDYGADELFARVRSLLSATTERTW
jgi:hypothetical protein